MTMPSSVPSSADIRASVSGMHDRRFLVRYAWLSIAAAIATILLKGAAWKLSGSVGLFSDAAESLVNIVAAIGALTALIIASRPADKTHQFGHSKVEYFSASAEGLMILVAAIIIIVSACERFLHPRPLDEVGLGLLVSVIASVVNGVVAVIIIRAGKKHRSITLEADGRHLMTDVYTTIGVIVGVGLVGITKWLWLDPLVALAVGFNIIWAGIQLLRTSIHGLMDGPMDEESVAIVTEILNKHKSDTVHFHAIRHRISASQAFLTFHMLVPGDWTVQRAHTYADQLELELMQAVPGLSVSTHLEPREDPVSYEDMTPFEAPEQPRETL